MLWENNIRGWREQGKSSEAVKGRIWGPKLFPEKRLRETDIASCYGEHRDGGIRGEVSSPEIRQRAPRKGEMPKSLEQGKPIPEMK